jgi:hypothetical protein
MRRKGAAAQSIGDCSFSANDGMGRPPRHIPDRTNRTNAEPKERQCYCGPKKKAPAITRKGLFRLDFLAPRPGLEPGTYGLTGVHFEFSRDLLTFLETTKILINQ